MASCGECTMCCELLPIKALNKPANVMCNFCINKCTIHGNHPDECKIFECAYFQMSKVHIDLRPDNCKVIFEKISDIVFFGTLHPDYDLSITAKKQIVSFEKQGISTIIACSKWEKPLLFLSKNHNEQQINIEVKKYLNIKWQYQVM